MPITPPTASLFRARYPLFSGLDDVLIDLVIADVLAGYVDETWREADQAPAILALTAHFLAMEGHPFTIIDDGGGGDGDGAVMTGKIASVQVGDVRTTFDHGGNSATGSGSGAAAEASRENFAATAYGQQFISLRRKNFPAVVVV